MTRSRKRKLQRRSACNAARAVTAGLPLAPLLLVGAPVAHAQQDAEQSAILEEVVVTAQKQTENLQAVPMSISAFGTEKLEELRINSLEDAVKFLPSVTVASLGPGFTQVFMRGIANGSNGNHSGPMPSVGQYLDEQPITTIQGSIPIHIYDIERVEVLEGPQGTLYGASSQAGTIRTITNKPDAREFSAALDLQGNFVQSGDTGYVAEGYVNIPLAESAAVRLVGWYEHVPGYIDNVYGEMQYPTWDTPPYDDDGNFLPPTGTITANNSKYVKTNYNDVDTYGARALLKIDLNDSWSITPGIMGQETKTNGVFFYDPNIGDLKVTHFNPEESKDHWYQASLTVEGRIGNFELVYAGSYLDRNDFVASDYSDYSYWYDVLYGSGYYLRNDDGEFINPSQFIRGKDDYKMWSNELRLSSPRDQRFRFVVGAFAQQGEHRIEQRYMINDLAEYLSVPLWEDTIWLTEQTRKSSSYAGFGEIYYDITDKLTGTLGIRVFSGSDSLKGFFGFNANYYAKYGTAFCRPDPEDPSTWKRYHGAPCVNLNKDTNDSGNTPKANLTYRFDDDRMVYLTYSKGYRPGGVNRNGTYPPYDPDYLTNYEAGWKTTWLNGALRFNGAIFFQDWDKVQFSRLPPDGNGLTIIQNAGKASANGAEASVDWAATDGLLLSAGVMWVNAKLTESFCAAYEDDGTCSDLTPKDSGLPSTPSFKGNLLARYTFNVAGGRQANVQASYMYQTDVIQEMLQYDRQFVGNAGAYQLVDLSAGISDGPYSVTLFVNNLFNHRAEYYKYYECYVGACANVDNRPYTLYTGVAQPRTIGMMFRQEFGGSD